MIEDYILPQPLPKKLKNEFSGNTLKIGEFRDFKGFVVSLPNAQNLKDSLWEKLSPILEDFIIKGITPFPSQDFPIMVLVIPWWVKFKGSMGLVEGKIYDLSQFSRYSGRFLLVEKFEKIEVEKYLLRDGPALNGRKIYNIFDLSFPETSRDIMLSFFLSSGNYSRRIGGCTVSLLNSLSKYYASDFKEIKKLVKRVHPLLTKKSMKIKLMYEDPLPVRIFSPLKIKYESLNSSKATEFYMERSGREWEKSAITDTTIKMDTLIGASELPFIPYKEETRVDSHELREYELDIASYVIYKHLESPEIEENEVDFFKEKMLRKIESEFPLLADAMKSGIVMDLSNVNGFGEHVGRLTDSWKRLELVNPFEKVLNIYITLFERIDDVMHVRIQRELSALSEKNRFERIINRILWELNVLRPDGWDFSYFQKKLEERDITRNSEKIMGELMNKGIVIRKNKDKFLAVERL